MVLCSWNIVYIGDNMRLGSRCSLGFVKEHLSERIFLFFFQIRLIDQLKKKKFGMRLFFY